MNKIISFEEFFKPNQSDKIVLIIGSGIHKEFLKIWTKEAFNFKCWKHLFMSIVEIEASNIIPSNFPILDFEKIVVEKTACTSTDLNSKPAYLVERNLIKEVVGLLSTNRLSTIDLQNYPLEIFNPEYVSDVINLNFDLVIEEKLAQNKGDKKWRKLISCNSRIENEEIKSIYNKPNFQYRKINKIKFWHPHGDIKHLNSIVLGLRKYGMQIQNIEKLRNRYKANNKTTKPKLKTWLDPIMNQPILILGADISYNEWDVLFALISKKRNRARKGSDKPIFHMVENHANSNLRDWTLPISKESLPFKDQWSLISKLFKINIHAKN
jgi:hypothetical protein